MRDFLTLRDLDGDTLQKLLDRADELKLRWSRRDLPKTLNGRTVGLILGDSGFRNPLAFELGIQSMGGVLARVPVVLSGSEPIEDVARYLDNWLDCVIVRERDHGRVVRLAEALSAPVINARTAYNHPCEVLGDLQFVRSRLGRLDGVRVAVVSAASNIMRSWREAAAATRINVVQICPPGFELEPESLAAHEKVDVSHGLAKGFKHADVVVTDCWPSASDDDERRRIEESFGPLQVTQEALRLAAPGALFIPCPPVTRGAEVSQDAMLSEQCVVYAAKAHLLHAQNAVLHWLLADDG